MADNEIQTLIAAIRTVTGHDVQLTARGSDSWVTRTLVAGHIQHEHVGATPVEALATQATYIQQQYRARSEQAETDGAHAKDMIGILTAALDEVTY